MFAFCILPLAFLGCAKRPSVLPSPAPDPIRQLRADVIAAVGAPGVQRGAWAVVAQSLDRNDRLIELNPGTLRVPASVAKLAALAAAVEGVGWDYRFETTLRATGRAAEGVLHGDLLVVGSGDPAIGGRAGDDLGVFVAALKSLGIRHVEGRVVGDDDAIEEPRPQLAWAWDDLWYTSGALFGALNAAENRLTVTIAPGPAPGAGTHLSVDPHAASRPLRNRSVTGPPGSAQLLWPEQRPGEPFLTIAGSIPAGAPPARVAVSAGNPTFWFASVLRHRLIQDGIMVAGEAADIDDVSPKPDRASAALLYTYRSRPLAEIAQPLLKESINLYAEAVLRLNTAPGVFPTNDAALDGLRRRLDAWGIPREGWQLIDGSGLSRRNVIAADTVVSILQRMYDPSGTSPWMTGLPVAGRDGTLDDRMKGTAAEGNVRAKTGSMTNVRTLAGYVRTSDGEPLAFAIMVDNFEGPGSAANAAIDRIAVRLAEFSRRAGADR